MTGEAVALLLLIIKRNPLFRANHVRILSKPAQLPLRPAILLESESILDFSKYNLDRHQP